MPKLNSFRPVAFASADVTGTVVALTDIFTAAQVTATSRVRLQVTTNNLRYRYDGNAPTTSTGHILITNQDTFIEGATNVRALRLVRNGGSTATVNITLEG